MGQEIGGFKLLTLPGLVDEFLSSKRLDMEYAAVMDTSRREDLMAAQLELRGKNKTRVANEKNALRPFARSFLEQDSAKKGIKPPKCLSSRDLELLATAVVLKGIIATDEWPLRLVAEDLMQDPEDYPIGLFTSLNILHLLEINSKLTADERRKTVRDWIRSGEKLHRDWQTDYHRLFGESVN